MIIVSIGIGPGWRAIAQAAVNRMSEMTGLEGRVVDEMFFPCIHPSWLKCHLLKRFPGEDLLVMDADIIGLQMWNPKGIFEAMRRAFCAVPEDRFKSVLDECEETGIPWPDWYVNGGLLMFGPEHQPLWDFVWRKHPKCGRWLEQSAINLGLLDTGIEICRLPKKFNFVTHEGQINCNDLRKADAVNLHVSSCNVDQLRQVHRIFQLREAHAYQKEEDRVT